MAKKEKTAPCEPTAIGAAAATASEQSVRRTPPSCDNPIITNSDEKVKWLSDEKKIDEPLFCECFCEKRELRCIGGKFFSVDGEESDDAICAEIAELLVSNGITSGVAKKTEGLFKDLKLHCHSKPIKPCQDEIHVLNGVIKVDGELQQPPTFIPEKHFCLNRLNVEYDPDIWQHCYYPGHFMDFLCGLLDKEDIDTLQEYIGYCMIPTTKGQSALFLIGNGGEGKSRIGVVLNDLFGNSMLQSNFQRVENDKFARYNLCGKLVMYDDEMQMEALKSTGYVKNIITAEIPIDVEAKGKQSQQVQVYCRFFCVGNGSPKTLYDKSDGFARRLLILTTKPKPPDRVDNPNLSEIFRGEKLQIFCWALDGLRRLIKNNFRFTVSEKTRQNVADAMSENNSILDFLNEGAQLKSGAATGSKRLFSHYREWCDENGLTSLKSETFLGWLKLNAAKYGIAYSNNVYEYDSRGVKKRVRGFEGIYSDYVLTEYPK